MFVHGQKKKIGIKSKFQKRPSPVDRNIREDRSVHEIHAAMFSFSTFAEFFLIMVKTRNMEKQILILILRVSRCRRLP